MQITKREKKLLVIVGVILIISGIYYFIYSPVSGEIEDLFAQVEVEQQQLMDLIAMAEVNESMKEEIELIESEIEDALRALPEVADEPGLVKHLHSLFVPFGGLNTIHIEDPVSRGEFSGVGVRLTYDLNHEEFREVMVALEGSPYRNRIDSFSLHRIQDQNGNEVQEVAVSMSLTFYFSN